MPGSLPADGDQPIPAAEVAALERTDLAWERTGIGVAAIGALLLHTGADPTAVRAATGGVLLAVAALMTLVVAPARYRRARISAATGTTPVQPALIAATAATVVAVCLVVAAEDLLT